MSDEIIASDALSAVREIVQSITGADPKVLSERLQKLSDDVATAARAREELAKLQSQLAAERAEHVQALADLTAEQLRQLGQARTEHAQTLAALTQRQEQEQAGRLRQLANQQGALLESQNLLQREQQRLVERERAVEIRAADLGERYPGGKLAMAAAARSGP
jgi:hypothetical protein